jgi:hypothetical protein
MNEPTIQAPAPAPAAALTIRLLPPEEWERMRAFPPFDVGGLPTADQWRIIVAEEGDRIVAFTCLFAAVHWEPWYIDPARRGLAGIVRGLLREGLAQLRALDVGAAFAVVRDTDAPTQTLVERLGFTPAPGQLYTVIVDDFKEY